MKKILAGLVIAITVATISSSASANYLKSQYDSDFMECSNVAGQKSKGMSDAMYLGMFYGCMTDRGYDVSSI